ncbi:flavin monoamine oxidase family protein [Acidisoma silvae]|uniref:Tryptophan 2-monooxygenase n=1 Tax=Acidisoma silvae TaxID=2802396 RepID=A0A964E0J7_9PROT|nr:NAD(P)/FAD-dependent oxidoreductase [Acidisoma silvae]MCB8877232.1 FAD-dependent oxidoreductase [Acidisoma silvae]
MTFVDVLIIGAGSAGLSAAASLRAAGKTTLVLEASHRTGGRARTSRPDVLGGAWLDEGAAWLHMAEENPLVHLAQARGVPLREAFGNPSRMFLGGREASPDDHAAYEAAESAWFARVFAHPKTPDVSLAEAIGPFRWDNPFAPTIETWEASLIEAADATALSLADFCLNQISGTNLMAPDGLGQLLLDMLLVSAGDIRLNCPATRIDWDGPGVRIETPQGVVTAGAVIVTVSVGVLAAGHIGFAPALPPRTAQAIADLPMGLLSKVILRATDGDRLGMAGPTQLFRCIEKPGDPFLSFIAWPRDTDHVIGFMGGQTAWDLAYDPAAALDFARAVWRDMLGSDADRIFAQGGIATGWGTDPHHLGAYTYARPGATTARAALAEPLAGGRLIFAGEACRTDGMAGTVGGAILDGRRAASIILNGRDGDMTSE